VSKPKDGVKPAMFSKQTNKKRNAVCDLDVTLNSV
jgi:hypothetical protein